MPKGRVEAFSDGVIAIIITIMVLKINPPAGYDPKSLLTIVPTMISYIISFFLIGTYWNNHHHLMHLLDTVNGKILWSNLLFLFMLSLVPVSTEWLNNSGFAAFPMTIYILVTMGVTFGYIILQEVTIHAQDCGHIKRVIAESRKEWVTVGLEAVALIMSFVPKYKAVSLVCIVLVCLLWMIPDLRIARAITEGRCVRDDSGQITGDCGCSSSAAETLPPVKSCGCGGTAVKTEPPVKSCGCQGASGDIESLPISDEIPAPVLVSGTIDETDLAPVPISSER